jgi:hypothetical protein
MEMVVSAVIRQTTDYLNLAWGSKVTPGERQLGKEEMVGIQCVGQLVDEEMCWERMSCPSIRLGFGCCETEQGLGGPRLKVEVEVGSG